MSMHKKYTVTGGQTFGRWTVKTQPGGPISLSTALVCKCECGVERGVALRRLLSGSSKSCGCLRRALSVKRGTIHGGSHTPEYGIWRGMLKRCNSPENAMYPGYGGRGITVCSHWLSFGNFIADMGARPTPDLSIERRDNDGPYSPENCYWATAIEQNNNTRSCRPITFNGKTQTITQWARDLGVFQGTIRERLKRGWTVQDALMLPVGSVGNLRNGGYKLTVGGLA